MHHLECFGLLPADVAVDEYNGRVFGVGEVYDANLGEVGVLNAHALNEAGETLWNFQEYGRNPSVRAALIGYLWVPLVALMSE